MTPKEERKLLDRVAKLESQIRTLATTLTTTSVLTNLILTKVGISRVEADEALLVASLESVTEERLRSSQAGADGRDSGHRQLGLSGTPSGGTDSAGRIAAACDAARPNVPAAGSANGDQAARDESASNGARGSPGQEAED